jgi:hypothetical protein
MLTSLTIPLLAVATVSAQNRVDVINPVCVDSKGAPLPADRRPEICDNNQANADDTKNPITGKDGIMNKVINVLSFVVGVACVLVIMISGLRFIVSAGDSNAISSARRALLYAVVGLLIVIVSRVLVRYILSRL